MSTRETKRRLMEMEKSFGMYIPERCFRAEYRQGGGYYGRGFHIGGSNMVRSVSIPPENVFETLDPEVVEWLTSQVQITRIEYRYISFISENDLFAFKMRWS